VPAHRHRAARGRDFPCPDGDLGDGGAPGFLKRAFKQDEGLSAGLLGREVIALLVIDRIDLVQLDEVRDVDVMDRADWQAVQVLFGDRDVLAFGKFVSTFHILPRHFLFVDRTPTEVLQASAAVFVEEVEAHIAGLGGGEEAHRDADHPKGNGAAPDRTHQLP